MNELSRVAVNISERLRALEIREVVYFHCDHFEPWQHPDALGEDAAKIVEFVDAVQQVDFARRLTLFYHNGYAARLAPDDELIRAVPDDPLGFVPRSPAEHEVRGEPMRYLQAHSNHDVQVHIHHEGFTFTRRPNGQMANLEASRALDGARLECAIDLWFGAARREFCFAPGRWFFVHGLWALNASDIEGCTIEDEIARLMRKGCCGDFTFPAGRPHCDPHFEAPYFCLPPARPKGYDSEVAAPEFAWGNRTAAAEKFFIWNSPIKAPSASLDWGHPEIRRGFAEPERLADEILERSFRWDGVLFIKTHAHSLHEMNRDADGHHIHPHCYGPIRDFYVMVFEAAVAAGADITFATAGEVYDRFVYAPQPAAVPPMSAFRVPPLGSQMLEVPPVNETVQGVAERLNQLATAAILARIEELGVEESGAEQHYAALARRGSVVPRHDLRAASSLLSLFDTRYVVDEIGAGIGVLPLLLAGLGIRARGIERGKRRYEACLAVAAYVEQHWGATVQAPEFLQGSFPACVDGEDLSDRLAIVTDFTWNASPDERRAVIAAVRRYRGVLLDLDRFIRRIFSMEERRGLIAEFKDAGIERVYDVDISPAHAFVLIVNDDRLLQAEPYTSRPEDSVEPVAPRSLAEFADLPESQRVAVTQAAARNRVPLMGCWSAMDIAMTDEWAWRAMAAAEWLKDADGVADIGCGNMTLERYLRRGQRYLPIDLVARDERTVVLDLNTAELPPMAGVDACAVLGVLEYLLDLPRFLAQLRARFTHAVVSFVCRREGETEAARLAMGWLNHHDHDQLCAEFETAGFRIGKDTAFAQADRLFYLTPTPPASGAEASRAQLREKLAPWTGHYGFDGRPRSELLRQGEALLADSPLDAEGWALVGRASHLGGETRFAVEAIAKAVANGHTDPQLTLYLARLYCEIGDPAKALAVLASNDLVDLDGLSFVTGICHLAARDAEAALSSMTSAAARNDRYAVPAQWAHHYLASVFGEEAASGLAASGGLQYRAADRHLPDGRPIVTLLDYKSPDLRCCTDNLGDYMQTYAVLQQLARLDSISFSISDPGLRNLFSELRGVREDGAKSLTPALHLHVLDRDAAWLDARRFDDRRVWALIYGWHYHRSFRASAPLPLADNIEPIVFSFHLADPGLIEPGLLDWLKRFEPIGCRDWNTVGWLLNQGIEAFFSGCVTATLPASGAAIRQGQFAVDVPPDRRPPDAVALSHAEQWLRTAGIAEAMQRCRERLVQYGEAAAVTTSRLHCYMPCRALGTPVEFAGGRDNDLRFEGLVGIDDDGLRRMAASLTRWLGDVVRQIATGAEPWEVRKLWREGTQEHVTAARARFGIAAYDHPSVAVRLARQSSPVDVHLTVAATPETAQAARVTIASALRRTTANVAVTVLGRGLNRLALAEFISGMERDHPRVQLIAVDPDDAFELLSLADAAPELDRIIRLAPSSLVLGDLAELARYEPGPGGIAARPSPLVRLATQAHAIEERVLRLDPDRARRLRTLAASRIDLAGPYFDPAVCVASLERLRRLDASRHCRELCAELGIDEWLALQLLGNGAFASLPAEWNANPYAAVFTTAKIIHWHNRQKMLSTQVPVLMGEVWHNEYAALTPAVVPVQMAREKAILLPPFSVQRGAGWTAILPEPYRGYSDEERLCLILHEDDRQLGPANAMEVDICTSGDGRYAVWAKLVCFSTSDGSDPNTNGRRYWLGAK